MKKLLSIVIVLVLLVTLGTKFLDIRSSLLEQSGSSAAESDEISSDQPTADPDDAALSAEPDAELQEEEENLPDSGAEAAAPVLHTYEVISADCSWDEACSRAEELGGYLAVITSDEEFHQIAQAASDSGLTYLWLGGQADAGGNWSWLNGEPFSHTSWYPGEPSGQDADGTPERYLSMWNVGGSWSWNDQRNDLVSAYSFVSGKVGFVVEYET